MNQINLFFELTRLKKPIGFMLLFWPCLWGLTLAYDFNQTTTKYIFYAFLFFSGSVLMRSAGCIVNDIADKNFDKKVERTKNRPIASGKVSIFKASIYATILCIIAFIVLINFNLLTIILAMFSMPLAFIYPFMKRFTYWPQLFLGVTFNYGVVLAWISVSNEISLVPVIFYFGAIFWTLGYDTIYGFQDINDDEIIGVKSTSIKFKNDPKKFLFFCYLIFMISLISVGIFMNFKIYYFVFLIFPILHLFISQIKNLNFDSRKMCLEKFKSNNFLGFLVFINILIGKLI